MKPGLSVRLALLNTVLHRVVRPRLARTRGPREARAEFDRTARYAFRRPPLLLHLSDESEAPLHWISCGPTDPKRLLFYVHGGGYFAGSPNTHAGLIGRLSRLTGLRAAAPAYRLAPEHPAPAAFDDICAAYDRLRQLGWRPCDIVLAGDSAGGGLAFSLLSELCARGAPPAGLVAFSPWVDLTLTGQSLSGNAGSEALLPVERADEIVNYVTGQQGIPRDDPRLSPLFATFDHPPPTLIQVSTTEALHDDAVRMAERLRQFGGAVTLQEWPGVPHAWPLFDGLIPEARAALREAAAFISALWALTPSRAGSSES